MVPLRDPELSQSRAQDLLDESDAIPRAGRKGARRMFVLVSGPPPFEAKDAWSKERVQDWAETAVAWIEKSSGKDAVIESANMHVDERAPHVHVTVIPAISDKKGRKLSAKGVQRRMAGLGDTGREHGSTVMRKVQDRFFAAVSEPFDLARKRDGGRRTRETPDRAKGMADRLADTQHQVQNLEKRLRTVKLAAARERVSVRRAKARVKGQDRLQGAERGPKTPRRDR